jgi:prepilin-type N-terminal cleavage/methylation domain-containing protein
LISSLKNESGYSLVEVMVAILLLALAIIPMVGMFDAGLRAAVLGGNYDQARALAGKQIETAKSLSYSEVKTNFPSSPAAFDASGLSVTTGRTDPDPIFSNFTYEVRKQFKSPPAPTDPDFLDSNTDVGMMKITVIVEWDGGAKSFETSMLKVR